MVTKIDEMVNQIKTMANTGLYGSPKGAKFMQNVSRDLFSCVASPVKAQAFAKFYKEYDKKKTPVYAPLPKLSGTTPIKKLLKKVKKTKATKKQKTPSPDYKAIAKAAQKARENYYKKKSNVSLKQK